MVTLSESKIYVKQILWILLATIEVNSLIAHDLSKLRHIEASSLQDLT